MSSTPDVQIDFTTLKLSVTLPSDEEVEDSDFAFTKASI